MVIVRDDGDDIFADDLGHERREGMEFFEAEQVAQPFVLEKQFVP